MKRIGHYEVGEILGEGGMGTVYRSRDPRFDRPVAIKVLYPQLARQTDIADRFRSEAVIQAKLSHPNIVTVHDFIAEGEVLAFVMELVEGRTLEEILSSRSVQQPLEWTVEVISQVLDAMAFAHGKGLIHRDLKPSNIIVSEHGRKPFAQVMDFGIAKILGSEKHKTATAAKMGTLAYMSPEHVRSPKHVDVRSDIYSLGAVLFELLEGKVPFDGDTEFEVMSLIVSSAPPPLSRRAVSPGFDRVIGTAMAKDPAQRFADCSSFLEALLQAAARRNRSADLPKKEVSVSVRGPSPEVAEAARSQSSGRLGASGLRGQGRTILWVLLFLLAVSVAVIAWMMSSMVQEEPTSSIEVRSNEPGSVVSINGQSLGPTPYTGELGIGRHLVEVVKSGCETHQEWVQAEVGVAARVSISLACSELEARSRLETALAAEDVAASRAALAELEDTLGSKAADDTDVTRAQSWLAEEERQRLAEQERERLAEEERQRIAEVERARDRAAQLEAERKTEEARRQAAKAPVGTVVDVSTYLMWSERDNLSNIDWHGANRYCSDLELGGFRNWRMATIGELEGIFSESEVDDCTTSWTRERGGTYTCHPSLGIDLSGPWIWSSTKQGSSTAFLLHFSSGSRNGNSLAHISGNRVLCVRRWAPDRN